MRPVSQADIDAAIRQYNGMIRRYTIRGRATPELSYLIEFVADLEKAKAE